jgi:hypothetical protein
MTRPQQSCALTTFVHWLTFTTVSRAETVPDSTASSSVFVPQRVQSLDKMHHPSGTVVGLRFNPIHGTMPNG